VFCHPLYSLVGVSADCALSIEQGLLSKSGVRLVNKDDAIDSSEVEEWLILVQRGYYNNPVPAYFSTSHRLF